MPRIIWK